MLSSLLISLSFAATPTVSKLGFDAKSLFPRQAAKAGFALEGRYARFIDDTGLHGGFGVGFESPGGQSLSSDLLYYFGPSAGFDFVASKTFTITVSGLTGILNGKIDEEQIAGPVFFLQPNIGFGMIIGSGWRANLVGGYFFVPNRDDLTGAVVGLRLERKTKATISGLDN